MARTDTHSHFRYFDKYEFIKSFVATVPSADHNAREQKEKEAVVIAEAIKEREEILVDNLATKRDLEALRLATKRDLEELRLATKIDLERGLIDLEHKLIIKLTIIMATLLTFLPLATEFLKKLFN